MNGKLIKGINFLSNLLWKIPEEGELNKYVFLIHIGVFYDFHVMFIQQTSPVFCLHYQWLRCIHWEKLTL